MEFCRCGGNMSRVTNDDGTESFICGYCCYEEPILDYPEDEN
jgi:hypothetical protein